MENGPFADDFPNKTSIYNGFSIAMLNYQRVYPITSPTKMAGFIPVFVECVRSGAAVSTTPVATSCHWWDLKGSKLCGFDLYINDICMYIIHVYIYIILYYIISYIYMYCIVYICILHHMHAYMHIYIYTLYDCMYEFKYIWIYVGMEPV